jgi:signal transduction histidine kinase
VEDAGKGMAGVSGLPSLVRATTPIATAHGLGLARMRERLRRVAGKLEIESSPGKIIIKASIPVPVVEVQVNRC